MNRDLFSSDDRALNDAGGLTFKLSPKEALAQYCATGIFQDTFYVDPKDHFKRLLELCDDSSIDDKFIAQCALYSKKNANLKDMPVALLCILFTRKSYLVSKLFPLIIDNHKAFTNLVTMIRSSQFGRKNFGHTLRKLCKKYLESKSSFELFKMKIGNPSFKDLVGIFHPKLNKPIYDYMIKDTLSLNLDHRIFNYYSFKNGNTKELPNVPFELLTSLPLTKEHYAQLVNQVTYRQLFINSNNFLRKCPECESAICNRLLDIEEFNKVKIMPYSIFSAMQVMTSEMVKIILAKLLELSLSNAPKLDCTIIVDSSGSMDSLLSNHGKTKYWDIAVLFATALRMKNPSNRIVLFDTKTREYRTDKQLFSDISEELKDSCMGGGTELSCAFDFVNSPINEVANNLVIISDNASWINTDRESAGWNNYKQRHPEAKCVCINIAPTATSNLKNNKSILNVGGFNDSVFSIVESFIEGDGGFVSKIEGVNIDG